jgi:fibro-slime domain-containing protein
MTIIIIAALFAIISCETGRDDEVAPGDDDSNGDDDNDDNDNNDDDGFEDDDDDDDNNDDTDSDTECNTVMMAVIRDFSMNHADFEAFEGESETPGLVKSTLGSDQKPVFQSTGDTGPWGPQLTGATEFSQWYNDVGGTNHRFEYAIPLEETPPDSGIFVYESAAFYPLSNDDGFGDEGQIDENNVSHNYHFTTEVHLEFIFEGGEIFTFRGDDDLWLFINNQLALDIGGLHIPVEKTVNLDTLGLTEGETYPMDIFHAERHTTWSNFKITTTIECLDPIIIVK